MAIAQIANLVKSKQHSALLNPPSDASILALYVAAGLRFLSQGRSRVPQAGERTARKALGLAGWKIDRQHRTKKSWTFGDPIPKNWTRRTPLPMD